MYILLLLVYIRYDWLSSHRQERVKVVTVSVFSLHLSEREQAVGSRRLADLRVEDEKEARNPLLLMHND